MIGRIALDNVLAFRQLTLELRPLTLLSGTNSSGKTSILHALALLRQSYDARLLHESLMLNGDLVRLGVGQDILHNDFADLLNDRSPALRIAVDDLSWTAGYERSADTLRLLGHAAEPTGPLFGSGFQCLGADRIVPAVTYPRSHEAVSVRRSLGARGEHTANFLRVHSEQRLAAAAAAHPSATSRQLLDQVNAWLAEVSVGTTVRVDDVEGADLVRLVFLRSGPDVKTEQRATNVGFGLTYSLPIIVACLAAQPGSLLLIENPEAHLHPRAQAVLGRLLARTASSGVQIVVETHSDHVLNAVRLAVKSGDVSDTDVLVHFLSRPSLELQPTISSLAIGNDGMINTWPPGFFDEFDNALDELLG